MKEHLRQEVRQGIEALPGCQAFKIRALLSRMDKPTRRKVAGYSDEYLSHLGDEDTLRIAHRVVQSVLTRTKKHSLFLCEYIEDAFEVLSLNLDEYLPEPPKDGLNAWFREVFGTFPVTELNYDEWHAWWREHRGAIGKALRKRVKFGELIAHDDERIYEEAQCEMFSVACAKLAKLAGIELDDVSRYLDAEKSPDRSVHERWERIRKEYILPPGHWDANSAQRQRAYNFFFDTGMFDLEFESLDE